MLHMFLLGLGEHQNVIQVNKDEHIDERPENVVHQPLKCSGSICQPEAQHTPLEVSEWGAKSSLRHIIISHPYLVTPPGLDC